MSLSSTFLRGFAWYAAVAALGCGDGGSTSSTPPPSSSGFAVFTDSASGFSTTDVYDVDNQVVRFVPGDRTMLWVQDNLLFDGWVVEGNFMGEAPPFPFQVRFGTVNGQRRAYFTEAGRGTLCDLRVENRVLTLLPTNTLPPST
jgi:hypothetical protein